MPDLSHPELVAALAATRQQGMSAVDAVRYLAQAGLSHRATVPDPAQAGAVPLAASLREAYGDALAALDIAIILRNLDYPVDQVALALHQNFPTLGALDTGIILLNHDVYPDTERPALFDALEKAGYAGTDSDLAANVLFPLLVTVQAKQAWQDAGLNVSGTQTTTIVYQSGQWSASPGTGMRTGKGAPGYIAKPFYTLPGAPEGALIGRIGARVFLVGDQATVPRGVAGALQFCINDDLDARYGNGLADNQGSLVVKVSTSV